MILRAFVLLTFAIFQRCLGHWLYYDFYGVSGGYSGVLRIFVSLPFSILKRFSEIGVTLVFMRYSGGLRFLGDCLFVLVFFETGLSLRLCVQESFRSFFDRLCLRRFRVFNCIICSH